MIGKLLNGRYKIISKVGSGGMADVYKGMDIYESKVVAVKVLKTEYSSDPQYLRRLNREAQAMVSLKNDHVVSLLDMGNEGDIHYLVLEYVDGVTLREYMDQNGALSPNDAVDIVCDVLDGLAHAHKKGLIHRDVKPQNIMITEDGVIKLADFGIAKFAGKATKTYDGKEAVGSVYYISPEQAKGDEVDSQTDLYSVGVMLYEMLLGKPPFTGENAVQVALKHVNDEIVPLHDVNDRIPVALSDVVERATDKDRAVRYSDAEEMQSDLRRALKNPLSRFAKVHHKKDARRSSGGKKQGFLKEHLPLIAIIGCVAGIIGVFLAMFLISQNKGNNGYDKVPKLLGLTEENAAGYAKNRGFDVTVAGYEASDEYDAGTVCRQEPEALSKAKPGTVVSITISLGMDTVSVPDLFGKTVDEAKTALAERGLVLDSVIDYESGPQVIGTVIKQSPNPDETVMIGDVVKITVCKEPIVETIRMPDLFGKPAEDAVEELKASGITNYRIFVTDNASVYGEHPDGTVVDQNPSAGMDIIYSTILAEIYVFRNDPGEYTTEFGENLTLSDASNDVVVTVVTELGEVVLYRKEFASGTISMPFTAHYWEEGKFTCIIYVNGNVYTSVTRVFDKAN